jgi:transcriptional regulator with XRE-family HTH domain
MTHLTKVIAKTVKCLRILNNKTQADLAREIGVGQDFVSHIEGGTRQPSLETIFRMSSSFRMNLSKFFEIAEAIERLGENHPIHKIMINRSKEIDIIREIQNQLD